jgi:hypothetical protein
MKAKKETKKQAKKGFFDRLFGSLDEKLEKKSEESCCCCSGKCSK